MHVENVCLFGLQVWKSYGVFRYTYNNFNVWLEYTCVKKKRKNMHMQFKWQTFMFLLVLSFVFFSLVTKNSTIFRIFISVRDEWTFPTWPTSWINGRDKNTNISAVLHTAVITSTCDLTWRKKKEERKLRPPPKKKWRLKLN